MITLQHKGKLAALAACCMLSLAAPAQAGFGFPRPLAVRQLRRSGRPLRPRDRGRRGHALDQREGRGDRALRAPGRERLVHVALRSIRRRSGGPERPRARRNGGAFDQGLHRGGRALLRVVKRAQQSRQGIAPCRVHRTSRSAAAEIDALVAGGKGLLRRLRRGDELFLRAGFAGGVRACAIEHSRGVAACTNGLVSPSVSWRWRSNHADRRALSHAEPAAFVPG
jgi:hypothetical protein